MVNAVQIGTVAAVAGTVFYSANQHKNPRHVPVPRQEPYQAPEPGVDPNKTPNTRMYKDEWGRPFCYNEYYGQHQGEFNGGEYKGGQAQEPPASLSNSVGAAPKKKKKKKVK
jgi:hypothetical protein